MITNMKYHDWRAATLLDYWVHRMLDAILHHGFHLDAAYAEHDGKLVKTESRYDPPEKKLK